MYNYLLISVSNVALGFMLCTTGSIFFLLGCGYMARGRNVPEKEESKVVSLEDYETFESSKYEWEKESVN